MLRSAEDSERNEVIKLVQEEKEVEEPDLKRVLELINKYKGIEYTVNKADSYIKEAKNNIEIFKDSEYRQALFTLCDFVLKRET